MGDAIDLNLFPSCYNCLAWSDDGELAVAAGDSVHLQLPQWKPTWVHPLFEKEKSLPWTSAKIRTNLFTHAEWEVAWPSDRDSFSIGAEQSLSTVGALAWSPPGLGRHRRCVLAVLTSNLLLSFYEADGRRKTWSRVAVVNHALDAYFRAHAKQHGHGETGSAVRKSRVRAFAWCPPLKREEGDGELARWGEQLLVVSTDDNDVVLVRVMRNGLKSITEDQYVLNVVAHIHVNQPGVRKFGMVCGSSLWADALEMRARVLHLSCGPWRRAVRVDEEGDSVDGSGAMVALVYGSRLQFINVHAAAGESDRDQWVRAHLSMAPDALFSKLSLDGVNFTGPLQWIPSNGNILLVAGYLGGRVTLRFDTSAYVNHPQNKKASKKSVLFHQRSFQEQGDGFISMGATYYQHNEPMTGIVAAGELDSPTVYMATLGPVSETIALSILGTSLEDTVGIQRIPWKERMERYRQRYDIQYELGDMAIVRTWGLATFNGWLAVAFTMHPGDTLEYMTKAEENTTILFVPPAPDTPFPKPPDTSEEHIANVRDEILHYILSSARDVRRDDIRSAKVLYAACMCAIISHHPDDRTSDPLLSLTHQALSHLSSLFSFPATDELAYCTGTTPLPTQTHEGRTTPILPAKPLPGLQGPGGFLWETCQTCLRRTGQSIGLSWHGYDRSMCENGHRWNRCNLTFLSIQEPYIAPFCSVCDKSILGRDRGVAYSLERAFEDMEMTDAPGLTEEDPTQPEKEKAEKVKREEQNNGDNNEEKDRKEVYDRLYDRYDVCAYCGGKYQDQL
ncbi:transcription factor IIIC subunit delta N-term-domain-containing protein [Talaromyces proteolyticus]|uniref:Transcription factor IIIC subunit delta N-term-domain-containing protein n=1 Tax=Talaromyces proteolyticus TaxID=1131652 RepID=A0AAD4KEX2_9EURO|nr:transcription factor IIIC subunit delta N-term-domain-containing protein [Talaromyces proteolyticus]KAH8690029.1 transcription factor IIIC subunit delta N-term-domain-containing protein [Talaromyces proteolyticus]